MKNLNKELKTKKTIAIITNVSRNVFLFKMLLLKNLKKAGYRVIVFASDNGSIDEIKKVADEFIEYDISRTGLNLLKEYGTYKTLKGLVAEKKIDLVMSFTIKPNIYSNLIFKDSSVKVINVLNGRGRVFDGTRPFRRFVIGALGKMSYKHSDCIYLNNPSDLTYMTENGYLPKEKCRIIKGEGLDISRFISQKEKNFDQIKFLYIGRLMKSKGVENLINVGLELKGKYPNVRVQLAGLPIEGDSDSVDKEWLDQLTAEDKIDYFGWIDDPRPLYDDSNCVVLATHYNEGMPMSLMEGAAMKTPIICSDIDACLQTVEDNVTGLVCKANDKESLRQKMEEFILLSDEEKIAMGLEGRRKAESDFDANKLFEEYHVVIKKLLQEKNG